MRNDKDNLIVKKTFDFALGIIDYSEELRTRNKFEMCTQLFKSGTSLFKLTNFQIVKYC